MNITVFVDSPKVVVVCVKILITIIGERKTISILTLSNGCLYVINRILSFGIHIHTQYKFNVHFRRIFSILCLTYSSCIYVCEPLFMFIFIC